MGLPGLAGNDPAIADGLLGCEGAAGLLGFESDVFIAGDALTLGEAGSGKHLDAMAESEDPLLVCVELPDELEEAAIVSQVLRCTTAEEENGIVIARVYLVE